MADIAMVKRIMQDCFMPLELTMEDFCEQVSYMDRDDFWKISDDTQTKDDIIDAFKDYIDLDDLKDLVKALLERFDKPSESIDDIDEDEDMCFLIRHGFIFISEEERRQKAEGSPQRIDELFDELDDIIASSQRELDELEEARANMLEEIDQKRNQILQRMEALRSRVAKLGAKQENIQPKKDERIREMEGK
ncbi:MAG: hypothetical protein SPG66_08310 [Anaerovibrio sp.]|nr:hypothetical protein [Anaerovibrio sp.]